MNTIEIAHTIINSLEEKKGEDIILLDIQEIASFTDYFVICTGTSDRMLDALANSAVEGVHQKHHKKGRREGTTQEGWLILDFGDVVVHLFSPHQRKYYCLEDLWGDGKLLIHMQ